MNCPLCNGSDIGRIEIVKARELTRLFWKMFSIDVSYLLKENFSFCECHECKLRFFHPLVTGDQAFYDSLQKLDWYYISEKLEYEVALRHIEKDNTVLEIGSGIGAFSEKLPHQKYTGLEFSLEAIKEAKIRGISILNEGIEDHSDKHNYDVVLSFQVLEHVSNPASFIEGSLSALKNNGLMIIAVPSEDSFLKYVSNGILNMPPHHVTRWSDDTLRFIAKKYDLEIIELFHERVQPIHINWYYATVVSSLLFDKLKVPRSLLGKSFIQKVILTVSSFIARSSKLSHDENLLPNGHTVVVVYKKK